MLSLKEKRRPSAFTCHVDGGRRLGESRSARGQAEDNARKAGPDAAPAGPRPRHQPELHPAIEAGARGAGPKLRVQLVKYFGCRFEDLFEIVLVDPETKREELLRPKA